MQKALPNFLFGGLVRQGGAVAKPLAVGGNAKTCFPH